jgi:hypothetical protein
MGESSSETVKEIEEIRARIDADIDALAASLPPKETLVTRFMLAALGGAILVLSLWFAGNRWKTRRQERRIRRLVRDAIDESVAEVTEPTS